MVPVSRDPGFRPIELSPDDEHSVAHLARFIEVLDLDDEGVMT